MKISASNMLKGKIVDIQAGAVNARVTIDLGNDNKITSIITMESCKNMGLAVGGTACAVIKASSVMVAVDCC